MSPYQEEMKTALRKKSGLKRRSGSSGTAGGTS